MCGIIGISGNNHVVQEIYDGLVSLQHRGQDAAGITTYDRKKFHLLKGDGLVREVFKQHNIVKLKGNLGIGHVRYPTAGVYDSAESQPFYVNAPFGISLIHNGNLTNYTALAEEVKTNNIRHLETSSDSEVLLNVVADEILKLNSIKLTPEQLFKGMKQVYKRITGSFSVIMLIADHGLVAFRDPQGHRPLIYGRRNTGLGYEYMVASESVALSSMGFEVIRDLKPGEILYIDYKQEVHTQVVAKEDRAPCIFEWVYLARPDSTIDGVNVYKARLRQGQSLAKKIKASKLKIDVVIPVPDSSRSAAIPLAHDLGVKYREGLVKNRYIGRTFIMPGQTIRNKSIRYKLNPIELELKGKNVLLVDDSIVRGNTSKQIVDMVRKAGAKKVYFASCSPPLISPCVYGVDIPTKKELIASYMTQDEIRDAIGADALFYQDIEDLFQSIHKGNPKIKKACMACFNGKYPTKEVTKETLAEAEQLRGCEKMQDHDGVSGFDGFEGDDVSEDQMSIL
ncbi:MAG: amidophosphoribosyltransferase [Candidatus Peregrinibacteria bacterium]|nr:amidophosphoribosyltransferase [Candidatus Peregrinibacteria bacterium]